MNLNRGNLALRLAVECPSVASHRATQRRLIRFDPNPNQFPLISSLKQGVIHVLAQQVSPRCRSVPTTLAPPAASAHPRSTAGERERERERDRDRERDRERERKRESNAFIQLDKCNTDRSAGDECDRVVI